MFNPIVFQSLKLSTAAAKRVGEAIAKLAAVEGLTATQFVACAQTILNQISKEKEDGFPCAWKLTQIIVNRYGFVRLDFDDIESIDSQEFVYDPDGRRVIQI